MKITKINVSAINSKNFANVVSSNQKNVQFGQAGYQVEGMNGDKLNVNDQNSLINVKNISDKKVGSKFLLTFNDPKYEGLTVLVKPNSIVKSADGSLNVEMIKGMPSFAGRLYGSIRQDADGTTDNRMKEAYLNFWAKGMHDTIRENYIDKSAAKKIKNDYNFYIPSDGDGTRYRDIAQLQGGVTKPASFIPAKLNGENMNLIHAVITNFAKTNKLDKGVDFIPITPAKGSGFAFLEGLRTGKIPTDKPLVFSWGDNFADIDYLRVLDEHEKLNSGFTVYTMTADDKRIKALGAVSLDNMDNKTITMLIEKPQTPEEIDKVRVPSDPSKCLASIGPYVISKPALEWIKTEYTNNPQDFLNPDGKGFDFSSMVIARIQKEFEAGKIKDENGKELRMKAIIKSKDDTWSDLGAEKDFTEAMHNIKDGEYKNLPKEIRTTIKNNVDTKGNITFDENAKAMLKELNKDYGIEFKNTISYYKK